MKRSGNPHQSTPYLLPALLATAAGFLLNLTPLSLHFGLDMVFGYLFSTLVSLVYGPWWGALSAALVGLPTVWRWDTPSGLVFGVAEAVWLGWWYRRLKGWLMEMDILFWLILGAPLFYLWSHLGRDLTPLDGAVLAVKSAVNALVVSAAAGLLAMLWPARWAPARLEYSLRGYLPTALVLSCMAPLVLVISNGEAHYEGVRADQVAYAQQISDETAQELNQLLHEYEHAVEDLAAELLREEGQPGGVQHAVTSTALAHPELAYLFVTDAAGNVTASSGTQSPTAVPGGPAGLLDAVWFQQAQVLGRTVLFNGMPDAVSGRPVATFAYPILDGAGAFRGIAGAAIEVGDALRRRLHDRGPFAPPQVLVDGQGRVLFTTVSEYRPLDLYTPPPGTVSASVHEPGELSGRPVKEWAGVSLEVRTPVPDTDWTVHTLSPVIWVKNAVFRLYQTLFTMALLIILSATLALRVITEVTVRPLAEVAGLDVRQLSLAEDRRIAQWLQSPVPEVRRLVTNLMDGARQLTLMAFYDPLTGLPNRNLFMDRLERMMQRPQSERRAPALLYLDLTGFKVITDSLGHRVGDQLLRAAAQRLRAVVGPSDLLARLEGDEFVILLDGVDTRAEAVAASERISQVFAQAFEVESNRVFLSASTGIVAGSDVTDPAAMLRFADLAMYAAKQNGHSYAVYTDQMNTRALTRLDMETELHRALENGELVVHYQPVVSAATGRISVVEALVRWQHPERGLILPGEFIPLAEETGQILPLGRWVLEEGCRQGAAWQAAFPDRPPVPVSINLSARQFQQQNLDGAVADVLAKTGVHPAWVQLEITETMMMRDAGAARETLRRLKGLGVSLALDDFGTGYSSMGYLKQFAMNVLKIDRSFVREVAENEETAAIVHAIITLARALDMDVVAEGVETPAQWRRLKELGVDRGQGFLFSRAVPADKVTEMLRDGVVLWTGEEAD